MSGVNKVILLGRLGKDPEVRHLEGGRSVANFTLATSEKYKDKTTGQLKEITDWHQVCLWGSKSLICEKYLKKGDQVYIEGKMRTRQWEKDGITRYVTEVIGDTLTLLGNKNGNNSSPKTDGTASDTASFSNSDEGVNNNGTDDLPF
ncbi:MAG TPA: single-stranded DNA-binding protein [Cyclobacteriaceae bacterium]|jgi:single-strand DNA-binding protein|nr:single-stranded DNA-binding protein [Cyclobacteriaceae bacterium]